MKPAPMPPGRSSARYWVPLAVFVLGMLLTAGVWQRYDSQHQRSIADYYEFRARRAMLQIDDRLHYYEQSLLATSGLFRASATVGRAQFARFVASLELAERYPGLQGIGYSELVPAAERARHEARVRSEGFPEYGIRPDGRREVFSSIVFIEPFEDRNLRAFGYDMFADPVRREAMCRARDSGRTAVSGKVRLVQEDGRDVQPGFLVFVPVFRNDSPVRTVEERRRALVGWVYAPFRMRDLMHGVLGDNGPDLDIEIYDGPHATAATRMWDQAVTRGAWSGSVLESSRPLTFGDRTWSVVIRALPALVSSHGGESQAAILLLGSLASVLLALLTFSLVNQLDKVRQLNVSLEQRVEERTRSLRESEDKFRTVADYTSDWEMWEDVAGGIVYCSPSCEGVTGYKPEDFRADPSLLTRVIHPEDQPRWQAHRAASPVSRRMGDVGARPIEELAFRVVGRDGAVRWLGHVCFAIQDAEGRPLGRRISNRDITERKQAEQALRLAAQYSRRLIEASLDPLVTISAEGKITDVNTATEKVTGVGRGDLIGSDFADYFTEPEKARTGYAQAFSQGFVTDYPLAIRHASGTITDVLYNASVYRDESGKPLGVFAAARDVTARKQAEAKLLTFTHDLEQVNQEMEDTLYAASHDLRSPLLNMRGFAESLSGTCGRLNQSLLRQDVPESVRRDLGPVLTAEIPSALHFIQSGGQKLDSLIDGLLVVSRARRQELHLKVVDMVTLLQEVRSAMEFQLHEVGATLELGELPTCVGDAAALNRVFTNLLDNALKYRHPDRAPSIHVSGRVQDGRAIYAVEDNGIGIDPRHHARIWRLFHRLDPDGPIQGEGLGLTLVQRILSRLRGRAWVESQTRTGTGSCFHVELPAPPPGS